MDEEMNDEVEWDFFNHIPEEIILRILSYLSLTQKMPNL